jgi:hypothetical protein
LGKSGHFSRPNPLKAYTGSATNLLAVDGGVYGMSVQRKQYDKPRHCSAWTSNPLQMFPISKTPGLTAQAVLTEWAEIEFAIYLARRSSSCMLEQGSQGISIPSGSEHEVFQEASLIRALIEVQPG